VRLGYYGKIPAKGDFLRHNCHREFVRLWDQWLQAGFLVSRESLGEGWQAAYEAAPLWRFLLASGVCGPEPVLGVMMPSQDKVGRLFPLTIIGRLREDTAVDVLQMDPMMTELENAALASLQAGHRVQDLQDRLTQIAVPALPIGEATGSHWLSTFFNGQERQDRRAYAGLPAASAFADLLTLAGGGGNV